MHCSVACDGNYRQGISVITAENLLVEDTILKNTGGTPPAAGIDFEPNHACERIVNCVMRNCVSENNVGCGYVFYLPNLTGKSAPLSLRLEDCIARGSNHVPFSFTSSNEGPDGPLAGLAEFVDCTFADGNRPGITIRAKPASDCRLRFVNCRIVNPARETPETPAILYQTRAGNTEDVGGVEFRVKIYGEGQGEAVAAAIFDPHGKKLWEKSAITTPEQFVATRPSTQAATTWKVQFAKPVGTSMEDFHVELQGIPPFLSSNPHSLFKPAK